MENWSMNNKFLQTIDTLNERLKKEIDSKKDLQKQNAILTATNSNLLAKVDDLQNRLNRAKESAEELEGKLREQNIRNENLESEISKLSIPKKGRERMKKTPQVNSKQNPFQSEKITPSTLNQNPHENFWLDELKQALKEAQKKNLELEDLLEDKSTKLTEYLAENRELKQKWAVCKHEKHQIEEELKALKKI